MPQSITQMLQQNAMRFAKRDMSEVVGHFAYPCAIYTPDDIVVLPDAKSMTQHLEILFDLLQDIGMVDARVVVGAHSFPRRGRVSAWVTWEYLDASGEVFLSSACRYLIRSDVGPKNGLIELVEFSETTLAKKVFATRAAQRAQAC